MLRILKGVKLRLGDLVVPLSVQKDDSCSTVKALSYSLRVKFPLTGITCLIVYK